MRIQTARCVQCGAPLPSLTEGASIACSYCGVLNRIDASPSPAPPISETSPGATNGAAKAIVGASLVVGIVGFGAILLAARGVGSSGDASIAHASAPSMQWEGIHGAILTDVTGDGVPDVLGRVRYVLDGDRVCLAAFDGATGKPLWESEKVGTYTETYQGALGLVDDTLLFASDTGDLRAFTPRDGKPRWRGSMPEKTKAFCRAGVGFARVLLADDRSVTVRLSDGQAGPPSESVSSDPRRRPRGIEGCERLASDANDGDPSFDQHRASFDDAKVDGMRLEHVLQRPGGPRIFLGVRDKGTSVPMIAAVFEDHARDWKSDLPGTRPLETGPFGPDHGAVTGNRVYTVYGFTDIMKPHELVSFDLAGHRQWEAALPDGSPLSAVQATDARVFVSQWGRLQVFAAMTGQPLFAIGAR